MIPSADCRSTGFRPHDLLWLRDGASLAADDSATAAPLPAPSSVAARRAAGGGQPVVVRRAAAATGGVVPVGLRGATRSERWAAQVLDSDVLRVMTPEDIARTCRRCDRGPAAAFAAVRLLARIAPWLDARPLDWGVTGGVGHALATGRSDVLHADSDLDLLLRAPSPLDAAALREVALALYGLPAAGTRIDVQVETPLGAFALAEWTRGVGAVLLKTAAGPRLAADPWADDPRTPASDDPRSRAGGPGAGTAAAGVMTAAVVADRRQRSALS